MLKKLPLFSYSLKKAGLYLLLTAAVISLNSCKGSRSVAGSATANPALTAKSIINSHTAAMPNFNTLAARVQVAYEDEDRSQSITTSVRMEKDKTIWIKASLLGITLAKVLITPERVSYYETIGNTYFDGDFEFLSNVLGTDINFKQAQAILLGQSIFDLSARGFSSEIVQDKYKLSPQRQMNDYIYNLFINPNDYKIHSEMISQPEKERVLTVDYGVYEKYGRDFYPTTIEINASDKEDKTRIEVNYKKIDLNVSVSFPFTIPDGYTEIEL